MTNYSSVPRLVILTNLCRELMRMVPAEFHFKLMRGCTKAFEFLNVLSINRNSRNDLAEPVCATPTQRGIRIAQAAGDN